MYYFPGILWVDENGEVQMEKLLEEDEMSVWDFESEEQKEEMLETITKKNCGKKLKLVRDVSGLSRVELAKVLGVSESTIQRIERGATQPTDKFIQNLVGLVAIGYAKYSKMSEEDKEKLSEYVGVAGGATAGVGGSIAAVGAAGAVSGFSAAGITSGLAAIGGGTMLGGMAIVAAIPLVAGAAGYGLVKGIKHICKANNLNCEEVDGRFEIVPNRKKKDVKKEKEAKED